MSPFIPGYLRYKRLSLVAGGLGSLLGLLVLVGWVVDISSPNSVVGGLETVKPNTAGGLAVSGLALLAVANSSENAPLRSFGRILSGRVALLGLLTLVECLFDINLGIDQILSWAAGRDGGSSVPIRMAANTAFNFCLTGAALVLLDSPDRGMMARATGRSMGPALLRRLVPFALGAPLLLGFVAEAAERATGLGGITAVSLMAVASAAVFLALMTKRGRITWDAFGRRASAWEIL